MCEIHSTITSQEKKATHLSGTSQLITETQINDTSQTTIETPIEDTRHHQYEIYGIHSSQTVI
jgi:hypothetical protein